MPNRSDRLSAPHARRRVALCSLLLASFGAHAEVFINELHYDDATASGDVGESVEIVATAGEDLAAYRVQLYNGSGNADAAIRYDDRALPAGTPASCGASVRVATVSWPSNGLQNGAADGIALVDGSGALVQFVSYEGGIAGADGAAIAHASQNLPVSETNATPAGTSLQLQGTASGYAGFAWATSSAATFGACNQGQSFDDGGGGGGGDDYYARVNTTSAPQLRCSLHQTIRGHTVYPYSGSGTSTWTILEMADEDPDDSGRILDVYRNRSYAKVSERAGTGSGITYNREHTWPNSLGFGSATGDLGLPNAPYTDTHMLYLSDTTYNSDRGNKPYAGCPASANCGERTTEANGGRGGGNGVYPGNSSWVRGPDGNGGSFEAWNARKGDLARAVMYMAIRYEGGDDINSGQSEPDLELTDDRSRIVITSSSPAYMGLLSTLLAWHRADPPDANERVRNEVIHGFQGNRNPFIDHPEWAASELFASVQPPVCELAQ